MEQNNESSNNATNVQSMNFQQGYQYAEQRGWDDGPFISTLAVQA